MAKHAAAFLPRFRARLRAYNWRRVGILAGLSLAFSLALVLYLFGVGDHFFGRLFSGFLVWFWLLAATFLVVVPFVTWAAASWFGKGWQAETPAGRAGSAAKVVSRSSPRSSSHQPHSQT